MSLFPNSRLGVAVEPGHLGLAWQSDKKNVRTDVIELDRSRADDPLAHSAALNDWLQSKPGKPTLSLVFSDLLVRYAVVPPLVQNQWLTPDEFAALARAKLGETYGDMGGWAVAPTRLPSLGRSTLVSAIKEQWLGAFKALGVARKLRMLSMRPAFVAAWDRQCRRVTSQQVQFVFAHADFLTCAVVDNAPAAAGWVSARVIRSGAEDALAQCDHDLLVSGLAATTPRWIVSSSHTGGSSKPSGFDLDLTAGRMRSPQGAMATLGLQ